MSDEFITVGHSFNAGDLISLLPSIKNLCHQENKKAIIYQEIDFPGNVGDINEPIDHVVKSASGGQSCFNDKMFEMMYPLLLKQPYIHDFRKWVGEEVRYDIRNTRMSNQMPLPGGNMFFWPTMIYPRLYPDFSKPWIDLPVITYVPSKRDILINRTARYQSPYLTYFFLKDYQHRIVFVGLQSERDEFCNRWKLDIPFVTQTNFLSLAWVIRTSGLFIGNQSLCAHLALGTGANTMLEISPQFPNMWPTNNNVKPYTLQGGLEFYFNEYISKNPVNPNL